MNPMTILYFLGALLIFGLIVMAHEFGHFISARMLGIPVLEFAVGFGPKLVSWTRKGTQFSVRAIPLGGFCKYMGEDDGDYDAPGALNNQKPWKRFITVFSGPLMNFVLAFLAVFIYLSLVGYPSAVPQIHEVSEGMPAAEAGLLPGDVVAAIDGTELSYDANGAQRMRSMISNADTEQGVELTIRRGESQMEVQLIPAPAEGGGKLIGITMDTVRQHDGPIQAAINGSRALVNSVVVMVDGLKNLITKGEGIGNTMGPVGILGFMTREIGSGVDQIFNLIIILSLNLGIMNLLPIPALDGGRLVFIAIEGIRRKPIKPEFEGWVHAGGFILLMGLILVITYNDIVRLFTGGA